MSVLLALTFLAGAQAVEPTAAAQPEPKKEKKICRVDEESTGSRLQSKKCLTASEWKKRDQRDGKTRDETSR